LQQKARLSAMRGDWDAVMVLLRRAEKLGADNPWIAATLIELRKLADRRDDVMFAKESAFASRRMASRLAARDEPGDVFDGPAPSYLRRKQNQGKGEEPSSSQPRQ
jgi:hypothetical protein